jgi:formylglycine-generating enzyme required for sulfatase activity
MSQADVISGTDKANPEEVEELLARFDQAWQFGRRPALVNYLLPPGHTRRRELGISLAHIDLEYRLKAGDETPLVESYLEQLRHEFCDPEEVLRLIVAEYRGRWRREIGVRREEYLRRFPAHADVLQARLRPNWDCPHCRHSTEVEDEGAEMVACPACHARAPVRAPLGEIAIRQKRLPVPPVCPDWPSVPGYQILGELGHGGMGVVYKARQLNFLDRVVALKMIRAGALASPEDLVRFVAEAEAVARLEHPNVVRIYEVGRYHGQPYFSLEFVEGGSLTQKWVARPQLPRQAALLVEKLARAMDFVHRHGIVHRDLKPANVLLARSDARQGVPLGNHHEPTDYFEPKITDFGLAKRLGTTSGLTPSAAVLGTPEYMSPEQAAGRSREIGPPADVYGLGTILYEALTGRPPFRGVTLLDTLQQVLSAEPVSPRRLQPKVPRDLETICLKCLRKEAEGRYPSTLDLAEDLRRFLNGRPIRARPVGLAERCVKWARRHPAATALIVMAVVLCLGILGWARHTHEQNEAHAAAHARDLVNSLARVETAEVPALVAEMADYRRWTDPLLLQRLAETPPESREHLHLRMALAPVSDAQVDYLFHRLLQARPEELLSIRIALGQHRQAVRRALWAVAEDSRVPSAARLRAACALAEFDPTSPRWEGVGGEVASAIVRESDLALGKGKDALRPVKRFLIEPLRLVFVDENPPAAERAADFALLADYAADRADVLAEMDRQADDRQHARLLPLLRSHRQRIITLMRQELAVPMPLSGREEERDRRARSQARAAVTLIQLGDSDLAWPLLRQRKDPSVRTYLTHELARRETDSEVVLRRLEKETDVSARRALILSLGEFDGQQLTPAQRRRIGLRLLKWYRDDLDAGIHGAVDWLLRHGHKGTAARKIDWQLRRELERMDAELAALSSANLPASGRNWFVSPNERLTLTVIRDPKPFLMGTPIFDPKERARDRNRNEYPHMVQIPRSFAIATKEVTVAQFRAFLKENPRVKHEYQQAKSPTDDGPIIEVNWFQAAQFCNWLSKRDNIPREEWCYPDLEQFDYGMVLPADYLHRRGYRLPTEAEWEYACRAGSTTSRFYGSSEEMLSEYAWYAQSSNTRVFPVGQLKPNDLGLFDIYGNVMEWCQNEGDFYPVMDGKIRLDVEESDLKITRAQPRVLRGGSFFYFGRSVRSAFRDYYAPKTGIMYVGLRPVRTIR